MRPLNWAIIGLGRFGKIHARVLQGLPEINVVAACGRDPRRLEEHAQEIGVEETTTDYHQLLARDDIDVVSITTHWQEHFEITQAALASGKHVVLEKPMAATADQCQQVLTTAANSRGQLLVGHICRFDPRITLAREAIQAGRIGKVVSMHAKRNLPKAPGSLRLDKVSPLMGDGIHDADLMMWMLGSAPNRVYAKNVRVHDFHYPDLGWAMLEFGNDAANPDAVGIVETIWCLPETTPTVIDAKLEIIGSEGKILIDCSHTGLEILDASGPKQVDTTFWPVQHGQGVGILRYELEHFAECIRADKPSEIITPQEAARVVALMETAETSAAEGRVLEFVDPF